jgi:hypothetical protein
MYVVISLRLVIDNASFMRKMGSVCGVPSEGKVHRTMWTGPSYTISLRSNLRITQASNDGGHVGRKRLKSHYHLIPCCATQETKGVEDIRVVRGRLTGVCWRSADDSYLLKSFLMNAYLLW